MTDEKTNAPYVPIATNKALERLFNVARKDDFSRDVMADRGEICEEQKQGKLDFELNLYNFDAVEIGRQTGKVCSYMIGKLTTQLPYRDIRRGKDAFSLKEWTDKLTVSITLDEFKQMFGLSDNKYARHLLEQVTFALYNLEAGWITPKKITKENGKKKTIPSQFVRAHVMDAKILPIDFADVPHVDNGCIALTFGATFTQELFSGGSIKFFPTAIFKINQKKTPYAGQLGNKLINYAGLNLAKGSKSANTIKIERLTAKILPLKKKIIAQKRSPREWIIDPFESDMDALEDLGIIQEWRYCNEKKAPLTDEQLKKLENGNLSYDEWLKLYICFEMPEDFLALYPEKRKKRGRPKKSDAIQQQVDELTKRVDELQRRLF